MDISWNLERSPQLLGRTVADSLAAPFADSKRNKPSAVVLAGSYGPVQPKSWDGYNSLRFSHVLLSVPASSSFESVW